MSSVPEQLLSLVPDSLQPTVSNYWLDWCAACDKSGVTPPVVQPGALHQLDVEARITEWPEEADALEVEFVSVHPREVLYVSQLRFTADALIQPLEIRVAGSRPPADPPLGLTARAWFVGEDGAAEARLAGNTTLQIVTFDPGSATPLNLPTAALRLQQMMGELSNVTPEPLRRGPP